MTQGRRVTIAEERLQDAVIFTQPSRPVMITTLNEDGSINVAPFGWCFPVSYRPPFMAAALVNTPKKQQTLANIEREREFVCNIPGLEIAEQLVKSSYRWPQGMNKFREIGLTPLPSQRLRTPGFLEARAHIECRASDMLLPGGEGDHMLVIGRVVAASYDPECYNANLFLRLDKVAPAIHLEQWKKEGGQIHMFLKVAGAHVVDVPYDGTKSHDTPWLEAWAAADKARGKAG